MHAVCQASGRTAQGGVRRGHYPDTQAPGEARVEGTQALCEARVEGTQALCEARVEGQMKNPMVVSNFTLAPKAKAKLNMLVSLSF